MENLKESYQEDIAKLRNKLEELSDKVNSLKYDYLSEYKKGYAYDFDDYMSNAVILMDEATLQLEKVIDILDNEE